jgi:hypothetical protein
MSEQDMNTMLEKKSVWWSEPMVWLIIALPVSAVLGCAATIWLATTNADTLVTEEHFKDGLAVHQVVDRERKAASLGAGATLSAEPGRLVLNLAGRFEIPPRNLVLTLVHPADPGMDMVLLLEPEDTLRYVAAFSTLPAGKRLLVLEPNDKAWRIGGQWQAPFTGSTQLSASDPTPSTQHSSTRP